MTDRDRRISDHFVRLVQIVFGLVVAQSFLLHKDLVLHPVLPENLLPALALLTVYITTVLSWIDWHVTMELRPYNFNPKNRYRITEQFRLGVDLLVVAVYAYLLLAVSDLKPPLSATARLQQVPSSEVVSFLLGFPVLFATYLLSGLARRRSHGRLATNITPIISYGLLYILLLLAYHFLRDSAGTQFAIVIDLVAILAAFVIMLAYRVARRRLVRKRAQKKDIGLIVGIDVDGVLANQIHGVLPRIEARLGIQLRYEDVTAWKLPLGDSDIGKEILLAFQDSRYVLDMPLHDGARDVVDTLYMDNRVVVLTGRPPATREWTHQWLQNQAFTFDELFNVQEERKSLYRSDVLIDDYIGNIREYLENTNRTAVLVDQPWNRDGRSELQVWIDARRLYVVSELREVLPIVEQLRLQSTRA